jgi:hypothetical protein
MDTQRFKDAVTTKQRQIAEMGKRNFFWKNRMPQTCGPKIEHVRVCGGSGRVAILFYSAGDFPLLIVASSSRFLYCLPAKSFGFASFPQQTSSIFCQPWSCSRGTMLRKALYPGCKNVVNNRNVK